MDYLYVLIGILCFVAVIASFVRKVIAYVKDNDDDRNNKDIEELRKFTKPGWTTKKKVLAIVAAPVALVFAIAGAYLVYKGLTNQDWVTFCFGISCICIACYLVITFVLTKKDRSLEAVKDFLTMEEVQEMIKDEEFKLVEYPKLIRSEGGVWRVYESKNWLCVRDVLIPKNFIIGFEFGEELREDNVRIHGFNFFCMDGSQWFAGHMEADQKIPAKERMKQILPQLSDPSIVSKCKFQDMYFLVDYRNELLPWYAETMKTKQDFLNMMESFDYDQIPVHIPIEI